MKKIKEYKYILLIILLVLGLAFYWFEFRPMTIKRSCSVVEVTGSYVPVARRVDKIGYMKATEEEYEFCLQRYGL